MATEDTIRTYYANILQRSGSEVTDAEIAFYASAVDNGRLSLEQVRSTLIQSPEGEDVQDVVRLYQAVFGRVPDKAGLNAQVDTLRGIATEGDLASSFAASPEFAARFGGNTVDIYFVDAVYRQVLGRSATFGELDFYLTSGFSAARIVLAFSESPEFKASTQDAVASFLDAAGLGRANYTGPLGGSTDTPPTTTPTTPPGPAPDTTAPILLSSTPADDATSVDKAANIVLTFSEAVQAGTGNIVLVNTANAGDSRTIAVTDPQVTFSGSTVTINPTADLLNLGSYAVTYGTGVIKDVSGNSAAAITDLAVLNFTVADTVAPTLVSSSPADDATDVSKSADIVLNFSEDIQAGTGTITLLNAATPGDTRFISVTDATQVTISGSTVTINPTLDLAANGALYSVTYGTGVFLDTAGNSAPAIADGITLNFRVADTVSPTFVSSSPADDTTDVGADASIVLTYSEAIKAGAGSFILTSQINSADTRTIAVGDTSQVTFSNSTVTINPLTDLKVGTNYQLTFAAGVIDDLAGNDALGITSSTALNFLVPATDGADTITIDTSGATVQALAGNDTFQIGSTAALTGGTLDGGTDTDTLAITAAGVTIDGPGGSSLVSIELLDVSTFGATITSNAFNGFTNVSGSGLITFLGSGGTVVLPTASTATSFQLADGGSSFLSSANTGNFSVTGGSGNDFLGGGSGRNTLSGGSGDDLIEGRQGSDLLSGGDGADTFKFERGDSYANNDAPGGIRYDTITDFTLGVDKIASGILISTLLYSLIASDETSFVDSFEGRDGEAIDAAGSLVFQVGSDTYVFIDDNQNGQIDVSASSPGSNDLFIKLAGVTASAITSGEFIA